METEKKLETMEEELKLIKGELKESLASVRDYLLNMELPSSEFASVLEALGDDEGQKVTMQGSLSSDKPPAASEPSHEEPEEPVFEQTQEELLQPEAEAPPEGEDLFNPDESFEDELEQSPEDELISQDETPERKDRLPEAEPDEPDEPLIPLSELPMEEEPRMVPIKVGAEADQSVPKVNLLANLMHWVTKTKKEIGGEQLPAFLEVYGISGHLSPELKEVILHMADVAKEQPDEGSSAEIWSRAMLSLHGILTGGDAPLHPVKPFWPDEDETLPEDEIIEVETEKKEEPVKLKLVLPSSNGQSQEFCLDLKPEADDNRSQEAPENREPKGRGDVTWQKKPTRKKR